ncbi:hypothetical protein Cs308_0927 [Candidatus Chlamydia sanziniae]|uniref:Uncharacterized protein n=1 Tax=Candidatus Chlamydia sanziniae TaxID=1806891 RepID=A0A1A9HWM7_9CHLA|nr:hypothetical protein Cs308_0927 [Candidatus Chlamydia sanziniae]
MFQTFYSLFFNRGGRHKVNKDFLVIDKVLPEDLLKLF